MNLSRNRLIAFANRKGGCGKTTTAVNMAHALALRGRRVLLLDLDPQSHATISLGVSPGKASPHMLHLLRGDSSLPGTAMETDVPGVWLVPSARELMSFEIDFSPRAGSELYLVERLGQDAEPYDYLIFDPPPTVGLLTVSALVAAKEVYIPMPMHFLAMEGLAEMMRLIYTVNANWNRELKMMGVIPTFYNSTTRIAREITADIAQNFGPSKLLPGIRMNVSLAEAPGHGKSVMEYAPKSSGALDYMALADHIDRGAAQ